MKRLPIGFVLAVALIGSDRATATPINVFASRSVAVGEDNNPNILGPYSPTAALGAFTDTVLANLGGEDVSAEQTSDIQPALGLFTGRGSANVGFSVLEDEEILAQSIFIAIFDLTTPHLYDLSGELSANVDGGEGFGAFTLYESTSGTFVHAFDALNVGTVPLASSGLLAPGSYELTVVAAVNTGFAVDPGSFMGGSGSFDFALRLEELTTIPEPATFALLGLGLTGLLLVRGRKPSG